jgi:hypothetical protein
MKQKLEMLRQKSRTALLLEEEREAMRDSLVLYINKNPIVLKQPVRSKKSYLAPKKKPRSLLFLAIPVVLLLAAGSVSYAAERTLPGDALYPVKVGFNEPVRRVLAFTEGRKAQIELDLATRRLMEAEQLQGQERLKDSVKESLSANFKTHVQSVTDHIKQLTKENRIQDALQANLDLMAAIGSHQAIISLVTGTTTYAATTTSGLQK